ncbi:hypothetical protein, partial [Thiolapillus sp.]|uniref:hypothetical protein n=1 Tax=Thiolapillus sp. TaxID=2017437 RepID=UPI003AF60938
QGAASSAMGGTFADGFEAGVLSGVQLGIYNGIGGATSITVQACLRPRERFWDIPVPKIDSAFDNLFVPQPSWSPSTTQQLRKLVAAPYLAPI